VFDSAGEALGERLKENDEGEYIFREMGN